MSDNRYPALLSRCRPNSCAKLSGRELSADERPSISSTKVERHNRPISFSLAMAGVSEALINAIISSTLDNATAKPSNMCPRSRALRNSNTVRRVTTSRR